MAVELQHVLAGEGVGRREIQQQAGIDQAAVLISEAPHRDAARLRRPAADLEGDVRCPRPRDPDDADPAFPRRGGDSRDGFLRAHSKSYCAWHDFVAVRLTILTYTKSTLRLLASRASSCLRSLRFWNGSSKRS